VRKSIEMRLGEAAEQERIDLLQLNTDLKVKLEKQGVAFNTPDKKPFRDTLMAAGFYTEWKGKFGAEPWGLLEKYTGPL
jgi:TRAP-type transport system periplasmic protein